MGVSRSNERPCIVDGACDIVGQGYVLVAKHREIIE